MSNGESSYRRFLAGDETGIVEIIRDYKDGLILYINCIVGDLYTAEDLTEETFIKLYVKKPSFSGKSSFKTWLYSIGRHTAVDYIRRHSRIKTSILEDAQYVSDKKDIESIHIKNEDMISVHHALSNIKPEYSQVIYLVYFEGFDNTEAAKIMKKTNKQIRDLLYNAKKALKNELEKEGFVYEGL